MARDLLSDTGSLFVQIGDENVHHIKALLDEVFGGDNHIANIVCVKTTGQAARHLSGICDFVLMYGKNTKEIAALLRISTATVRNHVQHVLAKLKCRTRLEAVLRAIRQGLI